MVTGAITDNRYSFSVIKHIRQWPLHFGTGSFSETVVNDEDRLAELVPILMTNFKYVVVSNKLKTLMHELQEASKTRDEQQCNTIIKEYSELLEVQKIMAKTLGDRVVLNL